MISINRLYREVLSQFNFSIVGYGSIDEKVDEFFDSMVKSSVFYERRNLDFISYAYAILKNLNSFELDSSEKNKFFFNTFKERSFELFILHEYYKFKEHILEECKSQANASSTTIKAAELSSKIFRNPTPFRVIVTEEEYTTVKYDQHLDVLTFEIPATGIFLYENNTIEQHKREVFKKFEAIISSGRPQLRVIKENNIYTTINDKQTEFYSKETISKNLPTLIKTVAAKFKLLNETKNNYFFSESKIDTETLNEWVMFLVSHAFLSYFINGWIENIPSVIKDEGKNLDKKCLGVLIIGYEKDKEISVDERGMMRIIADRVSAAISTQNLLDNEFKLRLPEYRKKRPEVFQKLSGKTFVTDSALNSDIDKLLHEENSTVFNEANQAHKVVKDFVSDNNVYFGKIVPLENEPFNKYKLFFLDGAKKNLLENLKVKKLADKLGQDSLPVNIQILEALLTEFSSDPKNVEFDNLKFTIEYESSTTDYPNGFCPSDFITSFMGSREKGRGKLCQFLIDNYKDILINCNIEIVVNKINFLNLETDTEYRIDGPKFTNEFLSKNSVSPSNNFKLIIEIKK